VGARASGDKRGADAFEYSICFREDLVVPEPKNPVPAGREPGRSLIIFEQRVRVLASINLNGQTCLAAGKVDDIRTDCDLAAKTLSCYLIAAQAHPETFFSTLPRTRGRANYGPPPEGIIRQLDW